MRVRYSRHGNANNVHFFMNNLSWDQIVSLYHDTSDPEIKQMIYNALLASLESQAEQIKQEYEYSTEEYLKNALTTKLEILLKEYPALKPEDVVIVKKYIGNHLVATDVRHNKIYILSYLGTLFAGNELVYQLVKNEVV